MNSQKEIRNRMFNKFADYSTCKLLENQGAEGVIMQDFATGG